MAVKVNRYLHPPMMHLIISFLHPYLSKYDDEKRHANLHAGQEAKRGQITGRERQEVENLHIIHTASDGSTPHGGSQNRSRGRFLKHTQSIKRKPKGDEMNAVESAYHLNVVVGA